MNTQDAIEVVKEYFIKIKGANVDVGARKLIDWLNFDIISAKEENDVFVIVCEILENIFWKKKEKYKIILTRDGKIKEVEKRNGHQ